MKDKFNWKTVQIAPSVSKYWWKKSLGEACPHGREIMLVNGPYIRNTYSSDFVQGDNGFHSPKFCPKGELWLDMSMPEEEWPYVALHECHEAEDMSRGMDYEQAHDRAKRLENKFRRANRPGELRYK